MSEPRDYLDGLKAADYYGRNPLDPAAYLGRHAEPMTATYTDRQPGDDPEPGERFYHARKHKAVDAFVTNDHERYAVRLNLPVIGRWRIELPRLIRVSRGR